MNVLLRGIIGGFGDAGALFGEGSGATSSRYSRSVARRWRMPSKTSPATRGWRFSVRRCPGPASLVSMDLETMLIHGDAEVRPAGTVTPPIAQGITAASATNEEFRVRATEPLNADFYNRHGNPNHEQVAAVVAELEGAERAVLTGAGMSAVSTAVLALARGGDHVVGQRSMYAGVSSMMLTLLPRFGVECTAVDQGDVEAFESALRPNTALVLLESPSNPRLEITDLRAVAALARSRGALTLADNTFATPINQRPLDLGIDLVWHSATKYLGGHSDLMAGIVAGDVQVIERIWDTAVILGAVLAPFNAWLLLRGLRTLAVRMERHNANGLAVASALEAHPAVSRVHYPGLPSHRGHKTARRQMSGYGGVLAVELDGGYEAADAFVANLQLAKRAPSLGSVSTLAVHPAAMWAHTLTEEQLESAGVSAGLVRLATGIESESDLVNDVISAADRVAA
jgi:methionine-gamma-lyase